MFKMKRVAAMAALCAAAASPTAFAGWSGNVGAMSDYTFRGISQGKGGDAAVQGGIDWEGDSGLYAGTWASNIGFGGGTEQDFYVGFGGSVGELGYDFGATYYWYPEEDEDGSDLSTLEFYVGVSFSYFSLSYAYGDETNFFVGDGDADEAGYLSLGMELPINEKLAFTASVGQYSGDEIERYFAVNEIDEDSYIDYSIGLSVSVSDSLSASFQYVDTDIDDDDPKFIVGMAYGFDLR